MDPLAQLFFLHLECGLIAEPEIVRHARLVMASASTDDFQFHCIDLSRIKAMLAVGNKELVVVLFITS